MRHQIKKQITNGFFERFSHLRLQHKFFLYFAGLILLVIVILSGVIFYFQRQMLFHQVREKAFILTGSLAHTSLNAVLLDDYIVLQNLIDSISGGEGITSIAIIDTLGKVIAADKPELRGEQFTDSLTRKALSSDTYLLQKLKDDQGNEIWDTALPINQLEKRIGTARLQFSVEDTYQGLLNMVLAIGAFALVFSLALSYRFSRSISLPIRKAAKLAEEYGKGNFEATIPHYSGDEIGQMVVAMNKLSDELHSLINEKIANEGLMLIGEFASYIIHDLKNPLNGIHLLADGLHRKISNDSSLKRYSTEILLASQKVEDFIKRTLDIAKSTTLNMQSIQINELVEDTVQEVHLMSTPIVKKYDPNMPEIPGDYNMLLMALKNLLTNAVEAIVDRGKISIKTHWDGNATITISDTGIGIAQDRLSTIFRPFFSLKNQGHGLGLAMVKRAVILHQGNIQVESEEGIGSTFYISLPGYEAQMDQQN